MKKNRIYIKAKYKIDGKTDVLSGLNSAHDAKREIEKDKRAIKRGEYRFNAQ